MRALRTAGAHNVLVALRTVGDDSAADFMKTFYTRWLSQPPGQSDAARALRETRQHYIDTDPDFDYGRTRGTGHRAVQPEARGQGGGEVERDGAVALRGRRASRQAKSSWQVSSASTSTSTSSVGVVEAEGGAAGGGEPEMRHQRLGAVVAGAHRHALAVDHGRDVVRVRRRPAG